MSICEYDDKEEICALMRRYYGRMGWRKGLEERAILKGMLMERVRNIIKKLQKSYSPAQTADFLNWMKNLCRAFTRLQNRWSLITISEKSLKSFRKKT